jgi:hypothetical protein
MVDSRDVGSDVRATGRKEMKNENMSAEEHIARLRKIATATLKAANVAARHEGLTLVDSAKLENLEALYLAASVAFSAAKMTREYRDADEYNGKRWLIDRDLGGEVFRKLYALGFKSGPSGCLASEPTT